MKVYNWANSVPLGMETEGSLSSPDRLAPARIPVQPLKTIANTCMKS